MVIAAASAAATEGAERSDLFDKNGIAEMDPSHAYQPPLLLLSDYQELEYASSSSLRGSTDPKALPIDLPPIPPIHPVHTGSVVYSSVMDGAGTVTYRRDIHAPCDYGMLLFNIGPSRDELPYHYDIYGDAYLYSNNGGLCILYPEYIGYQMSQDGPFWRPGYDPTQVRFNNLVPANRYMHRISSRILAPPNAAKQHGQVINRAKAGDYIIMGKHDFYGIEFFKSLKNYVNGWGPDGPSHHEEEAFLAAWDLVTGDFAGLPEEEVTTPIEHSVATMQQ